ncbi:MAG TPA: ribonuclease HI [Firmicutes bacterium]|nr:ribonuclease HI [Bacillota bacterium]
MQEKVVEIYTDGACSGNPGPGGWGVVLLYGGHRRELSGSEPHTTNQRMELTAAIEGLKALKHPCRVRLYSDSAYLVNAFNQKWLERWVKNGWRTVKKTPVENKDLWEQLYDLTRKHRVSWIKVRGHAGNKENEHCDKLANEAMARYLPGESS